MTPTEKRIASFIKDHYDEFEDCLDIECYRVYADSKLFNGVIRDCTFNDIPLTDVLCLECVKNNDKNREYVQLFLAEAKGDGFLEAQEWFTFSELSRRDRRKVTKLFDAMVALGGFTSHLATA